MDIKDIIEDISTESAMEGRTDDYYTINREKGYQPRKLRHFRKGWITRGDRTSNGNAGLVKVLFPNFIGAIAGVLLLVMTDSVSAVGCAVMGLIGSVVFGMVDCMIMKKMEVQQALFRNLVINGIAAGIFLIYVVVILLAAFLGG